MAPGFEGDFGTHLVWYGKHTGSWWALVWLRRGPRLLEAVSAGQLQEALWQAETWPWPRAGYRQLGP